MNSDEVKVGMTVLRLGSDFQWQYGQVLETKKSDPDYLPIKAKVRWGIRDGQPIGRSYASWVYARSLWPDNKNKGVPMTKKGYTHISVLLDRSGSMNKIRQDTIGGFNSFLESQKLVDGEVTLTLIQFDSVAPYDVVRHYVPIADVPALRPEAFVPRGSTPLLDAIGSTIGELKSYVTGKPEDERPENIVVAIVTDGLENHSEEFSREAVQKMIAEQKEKGWQFVFLSADLEAVEEAQNLGISREATASYTGDSRGTRTAWSRLSVSVNAYRENNSSGLKL